MKPTDEVRIVDDNYLMKRLAEKRAAIKADAGASSARLKTTEIWAYDGRQKRPLVAHWLRPETRSPERRRSACYLIRWLPVSHIVDPGQIFVKCKICAAAEPRRSDPPEAA